MNTLLPSSVIYAPLTTAAGRHLNLAAFAGKTLVISDVMTLCQETCPLDTANLISAARAVDRAGLGQSVEFVSITIDPSRDTVPRLAAYQHLYRSAPPNWTLLTGQSAALTRLWSALGVYIQSVPDSPPAPRDWLTGRPLTYDLTHSDELFFIDAHSRERFLLEGAPHLAAGAPIPAKLSQFMDATGHNNVNHPDPQAWTLRQALGVLSRLTGHPIHAGNDDS